MVKKTEDFITDPFDNFDDGFGDLFNDKPKTRFDKVKDFAKGILSGAGSSMLSSSTARTVASKTLPVGYGQAVGDLMELGEGVKQLYDEGVQEYSKVISPVKRTVESLSNLAGDYIPKGVKGRVDAWARDREKTERSLTETQVFEEQISNTLKEIFGEQVEADENAEVRTEAREAVKMAVEGRHQIRTHNQLEKIATGVSRLNAYNDKLQINFQRKSLELQLKQYFIQGKTLEVLREAQVLQASALSELIKEVKKPDLLKVEQHEDTRARFAQGVTRTSFNRFFGNRADDFQQMRENMMRNSRQAIKEVSTGIQSMLFGADMMASSASMMSGMSGLGGMSNQRMAGEMIGGFLPTILAHAFGGRIQEKLNERPRLRRLGGQLNFITRNYKPWLEEYGKKDRLLSPAARILGGLIQSDKSRTDIAVDNISSINKPAVWKRQDSKSLTEIIPGLLSRIHREIHILRTGNERAGLVAYDYTSNSFTDSSSIGQSIVRDIINKDGGKWVKSDAYNLIDEIGGENLDPELRRRLAIKFLSDNYREILPSRENFSSAEFFADLGEEDAKTVSDLFKEYYKDDEFKEREVEFSNRFRDLGSTISSNHRVIQNYVESGLSSYLEEAGIIKEGRIDPKRLIEFYVDGDYDDELPEVKKPDYFKDAKELFDNLDDKYSIKGRVREGREKLTESKFFKNLQDAKVKARSKARQVKEYVITEAEAAKRLLEKEDVVQKVKDLYQKAQTDIEGRLSGIDFKEILDNVTNLDPLTEEGKKVIDQIKAFVKDAEEVISKDDDSTSPRLGVFNNLNPFKRFKKGEIDGESRITRITNAIKKSRFTLGLSGVGVGFGPIKNHVETLKNKALDFASNYNWFSKKTKEDEESPVTDSIDTMNLSLTDKLSQTLDVLKEMLKIDKDREQREKGPRKGSYEDLMSRATSEVSDEVDTQSEEKGEQSNIFNDLFGNLFGGLKGKALKAILGKLGISSLGSVGSLLGSLLGGKAIGKGLGKIFGRGAAKVAKGPGGFRGGLATGKKAATSIRAGAKNVANATKNIGATLNKIKPIKKAGGFIKRLFSGQSLRKGFAGGKWAAKKGVGLIKNARVVGRVVDNAAMRLVKPAFGLALRTLGIGLGATAGIIASPIILKGLAIAGTAHAAYSIYKYVTRPKPGEVSSYRIAQYGFSSDDSAFERIFALEDKLTSHLNFSPEGIPSLRSTIDPREILNALKIEIDDEEEYARVDEWLRLRFIPIFLIHIGIISRIAGNTDLQKVDKLKPEDKIRYHQATRFKNGPYEVDSNPFSEKPLVMGPVEVDSIWNEVDKKLSTKIGNKKRAELLKEQSANPEDKATEQPKKEGEESKEADPKLLHGQSVKEAGKTITSSYASKVELINNRVPSYIKAVDAVRFKTYGLSEFTLSKVKILRELESYCTEGLRVQDNETVIWEGDLSSVHETFLPHFGISSPSSERAALFNRWFSLRFLPVYTTAASIIQQKTKSNLVQYQLDMMGASDRLEFARIVSSVMTTVDGIKVSVWSITDSPWDDIELNTDSKTVEINIKAIEKEASDTKLNQEQALNTTSSSTKAALSTFIPQEQSNVRGLGSPINRTEAHASGADHGSMYRTKSEPQVYGIHGQVSGFGLPGEDRGALPTDLGEVSLGKGTDTKYEGIPLPTGDNSYLHYKDMIDGVAKAAGVSATDLATYIGLESDFRNQARPGTSSAMGLGQFIKSTWEAMIKRYGGKYGLQPGVSRLDPIANSLMTAEYMKENHKTLTNNFPNRKISMLDLYLAHFLGPGGATSFLKAMGNNPGAVAAQLLPKAANANKWVFYDKETRRPRTFADIINYFQSRIRSVRKRHLGIKAGTETGHFPPPDTHSGVILPATGSSEGINTSISESNVPTVAPETVSRSSTLPLGGSIIPKEDGGRDPSEYRSEVGANVNVSTPSDNPLGGTGITSNRIQGHDPRTSVGENNISTKTTLTLSLTRTTTKEKVMVGKLQLSNGEVFSTIELSDNFKPGTYELIPSVNKSQGSVYEIWSGNNKVGVLSSGNGSNADQTVSRNNEIIIGQLINKQAGDVTIRNSLTAFNTLMSKIGDNKVRFSVTGGNLTTTAEKAVEENKGRVGIYPSEDKRTGMPTALGNQSITGLMPETMYQQAAAKQQTDKDLHLEAMTKSRDIAQEQLTVLQSMSKDISKISHALSKDSMTELFSKVSGLNKPTTPEEAAYFNRQRNKDNWPTPIVNTRRNI
ncbi:MAG: transglycosylase SLT domain-containing protein [Gammaproteobacteria bacterium]|nr:transglycosylase SLT domain-containing protein [Acholeplasmataceae bacterium]MCK9529049.1 transglycosylase SLT domain-containing protein [Gammaproteobacteria bacterium]